MFVGSVSTSVGLRSKSLDSNNALEGNWSSAIYSGRVDDFVIANGYIYIVDSTRSVRYATIDSSGNVGTFSGVQISNKLYRGVAVSEDKIILSDRSQSLIIADLSSGVPQTTSVGVNFNTSLIDDISKVFYSKEFGRLYMTSSSSSF